MSLAVALHAAGADCLTAGYHDGGGEDQRKSQMLGHVFLQIPQSYGSLSIRPEPAPAYQK